MGSKKRLELLFSTFFLPARNKGYVKRAYVDFSTGSHNRRYLSPLPVAGRTRNQGRKNKAEFAQNSCYDGIVLKKNKKKNTYSKKC